MSEFSTTSDTDAMPHDADAERAVLGAVMVLPSLIDELTGSLSAEDFHVAAHQLTFETFMEMHR